MRAQYYAPEVKRFIKGDKVFVYGDKQILSDYGVTARRFNLSNLGDEKYDTIAKFLDKDAAGNILDKGDWALAGIGIGIDTYNDVKDVKSTDGKVKVGATDVVLGTVGAAASMYVGSEVGAAIGTAICPGVGTLAGLVVGAAVSLAWSYFVQDPISTSVKNSVQ